MIKDVCCVVSGAKTRVPCSRCCPRPRSHYLEREVQLVGERRAAALEELQGTLGLPAAEAADRIRQAVLPYYSEMLADLDDDDLAHAPARKVRRDLRAVTSAEEDLFIVRARVLEGRADQRAYAHAAAEFDDAVATWKATWQGALSEVEE